MKKIVIFDSGVGGLSVYQEVYKRLPGCEYIYFFDNEAFPYGELDSNLLIRRCSSFVAYLVKKYCADLVIIACNTASTIVLPTLRNLLSIPVIGVVPAIKPAAKLSHKAIGLLATPATIKRPYTQKLVQAFVHNCQIFMLGSTQLVEMGEAKIRGEQIDMDKLKDILSPWKNNVDCIVLGCTHFPLIKEEIAACFNAQVTLIDSGAAIASRSVQLLKDELTEQDRLVGNTENKVFCSAVPRNSTALDSALQKMKFNAHHLLSWSEI